MTNQNIKDNNSDILEDENDTWSNAGDWVDDQNNDITPCPFCNINFNVIDCFQHTISIHNFDFHKLKLTMNLDFYNCMRLINFVRKYPLDIEKVVQEKSKWLDNDEYLVPTLQDDALLYAFEDDEDFDDDNQDDTPMDTITDLDSTKLIDMIHELELKLKNSTKSNLELKDQFNSYKEMVYNTFMSDNMKNLTTDDLNVNLNQASQNDDKGNYYFESYAGNEIHESMLKDTIRTEAYRDFMYHNKHYFKNKVVLDVGCGTGILSMFAAKSGARQVFAVDNSNIIIKAKEIIKDNGLDHIITCLQGKVEEIELPVPKVDIIISEWMGYFLLFEGMLDSVLVARDRWLKDDGILGPSCTKILLATVDDSEWYNDTVNFWKDVYGFNMTAMSGDVFRQGHVAVLKSDSISSESVVIKDIQIKESTIKSLDFTEPFKLTIKRQGKVYGFCGWFDTFFEGPTIDPIIFSTSPMTKPTHWMQTTFILQNPLEVNTNDIISGTFKCIKSNENHRELIVEISFQVNNESIQNQSFIVC